MKLHVGKVCITFGLMVMVKGSLSDTENSGSEEVAGTLKDSTNYYIVRGYSAGTCQETIPTTCETIAVDMNEKHAVRCCSNEPRDGWMKSKKDECEVDVWATSLSCHNVTYAEAEQICISQEARLCRKTELESDCTAGSGCFFNDYMVWSSTPLTESPTVAPTRKPSRRPTHPPTHTKYYIVRGWKHGECRNTDYPTCNKTAVDMEEIHAVRCCSDKERTGTWIQRKGCKVWAESDVPVCYRTSYTMAEQKCADVGARLCTSAELQDGCTAGTGCYFNHYMVWSSTSTTNI